MDRRGFLGACALLGLSGPRISATEEPPSGFYRSYPRARLVGSRGERLRTSRLVPHENYLFFYPYRGTPCLLVDLKMEVAATEVRGTGLDGAAYSWPGGVGPRRSVVAYTAICPHLWSHPERDASVIAYDGPAAPSVLCAGGRRIACCAHGSCYDPAAGGAILQGPAEVPLAAVDLEWDSTTDELSAKGVRGRDSFQDFFTSFPSVSQREASARTSVVRLRDYSRHVVQC